MKTNGFTLLEMLIVLLILGVLAGVSVPMVRSNAEQGRANEAIANLQQIHLAQQRFKLKHGEYFPTVEQVLAGGMVDENGNVSDISIINSQLGLELEAKYYTYSIQPNGTIVVASLMEQAIFLASRLWPFHEATAYAASRRSPTTAYVVVANRDKELGNGGDNTTIEMDQSGNFGGSSCYAPKSSSPHAKE